MINRYRYFGISEVWTPAEIYRRWHRIECAHLEQVAGREDADRLRMVKPPSPAQVNYYERETQHDVAAFLRGLDANIQAVIRRLNRSKDDVDAWERLRSGVHYGLTSSDLVDTALAMGLQECAPVVLSLIETLELGLFDFINRLGNAESVGRTHGQLASPMLARHRWVVLAEVVGRQLTRVRTAFDWMDVGKLSGPVGDFDRGEGAALASLGLRDAASTQIVSRDRLAHLASCLSLTATICESIATQAWLLVQQGIEELKYVPPEGSVGSSAMPHKANPVLAETIRGLARMARMAAEPLQLGVVQWGEHDLAHSSVERVCVPDLLHLVCTSLAKTTALVSALVWRGQTVPDDYRDTYEELRSLQGSGVAYVDAHAQLSASYRDGKVPTTNTEEGQ